MNEYLSAKTLKWVTLLIGILFIISFIEDFTFSFPIFSFIFIFVSYFIIKKIVENQMKSDNILTKDIGFFVVIIAVIGFGGGISFSGKTHKYLFNKESLKTLGKITDIYTSSSKYGGSSKSIMVEYEVNGEKYSTTGNSFHGDLVGDTASVYYNPKYPKISRVGRTNPFINK